MHILRSASITALALLLSATLGAGAALAQGRQGGPPAPPRMGFFVSSVGSGKGGNLGGIRGADAHCQQLATAVGAGDRSWRAYLSVTDLNGKGAINARDRIGTGPWFNAKERIPDYLKRRLQRPIVGSEIHGDTLDEARRGSNLTKEFAVTEKGELINGIGDPLPTLHDMLTGTQPDGRAYTDTADHTCNNWTSNGAGSAQVGHSDRIGNGNQSWNSSHATTGCSQRDLQSWGGEGRFYCFAVN